MNTLLCLASSSKNGRVDEKIKTEGPAGLIMSALDKEKLEYELLRAGADDIVEDS